jgi:hypothetical protein
VALRLSGEIHDVVPGRSALHAIVDGDKLYTLAAEATSFASRPTRATSLEENLPKEYHTKTAMGYASHPLIDGRSSFAWPAAMARTPWRRQERWFRNLAIVVVASRLLAAHDYRGRGKRQLLLARPNALRAVDPKQAKSTGRSVRCHQRFDHHVARSLEPNTFFRRVREQVAARRDVGDGSSANGVATNRSTASRPSMCSRS